MSDDFADFIEDTAEKPTNMESVLHLFWDKGIDYYKFCDLPIPYIISIIKTNIYFKNKESQAIKKATGK